jgi:hypothetical protein
MIRFLIALVILLTMATQAVAQQGMGSSGLGWNRGGVAVSNDQNFVMIGNTPDASNERALTGSSTITITDGGANGPVTLSVNGPLIQSAGGTGFGSYTAGEILVVNDAGALVKLALGANGQVLTIDTSLNPKFKWATPGTGSVSDFSAGDLAPLFTTSVATSTTTPALTFSLSNAAQNAVFIGPVSGGAGAPTFRALDADDLPAGTGTVTSVGLSLPAEITVSNSPVTTTGTLTGAWASQNQNRVFASPNGASGTPTFRALVSADLPAGTGTVTSVAQSLTSLPFMSISGTPITGSGTLALSASCATGDIIYGSGTNTLAKLAAGSDGQILTLASGAPSWAWNDGFGGSGADGAVTKGSTTETSPLVVSATTFTVSGGASWTCFSGTKINATSTATFTGTTTVDKGPFVGGYGGNHPSIKGTRGHGPHGGDVCFASGSSFNNAGGNGASRLYNGTNSLSGDVAVTSPSTPNTIQLLYGYIAGSGGGGGSSAGGSGNGGKGGNGGGALFCLARGAISLGGSSTISAVGEAGGNSTNTGGGGGGGEGGLVYLASKTSITCNAGSTITVAGGAGGNGHTNGSGGGGGQGGYVVLHSPSNTTSGTITVSGGSGGTKAGTGVNGQSGGNGVSVAISGTPTTQLFVWNVENVDKLKTLAQIANGKIKQRDLAALAAENNIVEMCRFNTDSESICDVIDMVPAA